MLNELDLYNMTSRMGKLKAIDRFDGAFFGIMSRIGDTIDPQARILLETTYEAISDAGISLKIIFFRIFYNLFSISRN